MQVTALLRRVLPEVAPHTLASLLSVNALPPKDFSILSSSDKSQPEVSKPEIILHLHLQYFLTELKDM